MTDYCGIDIIEVERIKEAIITTSGFREKVFTKNEIEVGEKKGDFVKYQYYAGRFAAKEAVYKALSAVFGDEIWFGDIEILNDNSLNNRPYVNIVKEELRELQISGRLIIDVSISHIKETAVASAVARIAE